MRGSEYAELKAFMVVVERESFTRAADQLGMSPSALSQTIGRLETRLGVRLINRTTRSVAATEAGTKLFTRLTPLIQEMDAAVSDAIALSERVAGTLRINTLSYAARNVIAPRLGQFHRAFPDVVLDIVIDDSISDIVAGGFDAGIRVGERLDKDMIAVRLTPDMTLFAAAAPDYLQRKGEPTTPADLHRHDCINWRFPGSGVISPWQFEKRGKKIEMSLDGPLIANSEEMTLEAAIQGLGIFYSYGDERVRAAIASRKLKRVLADWSIEVPGIFLYYSSRRQMTPALRSFIDCMRQKPA